MALSGGWANGMSDFSYGSISTEKDRSIPIRLNRVHDYKDKFILRCLQEDARRENPGFLWFQEKSQTAKIAWASCGPGYEPIGYYICDKERPAHVPGILGDVWYPHSLAQIFVKPGNRGKGIGTKMVQDFLSERNECSIWVESPKYETRSILTRLGLREHERPYEVWQMMAGLTRWNRFR